MSKTAAVNKACELRDKAACMLHGDDFTYHPDRKKAWNAYWRAKNALDKVDEALRAKLAPEVDKLIKEAMRLEAYAKDLSSDTALNTEYAWVLKTLNAGMDYNGELKAKRLVDGRFLVIHKPSGRCWSGGGSSLSSSFYWIADLERAGEKGKDGYATAWTSLSHHINGALEYKEVVVFAEIDGRLPSGWVEKQIALYLSANVRAKQAR